MTDLSRTCEKGAADDSMSCFSMSMIMRFFACFPVNDENSSSGNGYAALLQPLVLEAQRMGAMDGYPDYGTSTGTPCTSRHPFKSQHKNGCHHCQHQKLRYMPDPNDPKFVCLVCKNIKAANMKVQQLPCIRHRMTDIKLYKLGQVPGLEWSQRWSNRTLKDIATWASEDTITIQISGGYTSTPLKLIVRNFKPAKGDVLQRSWVGNRGETKSVSIPSYAIQDLTAAKDAYKRYINEAGAEFFLRALDPKDELVKFLWQTYCMAIVTSNDNDVPESERKLLKMVLRLWVAIRLNTKSTNIVGHERLGMPDNILGDTHPTPGRIPIPPVMGNQIELILSRDIQDPLRARVLDALQELIYSNKPGSWFTIYLCTFILLHNCSMITKHDRAYARKHGLKTRFARPAMVEEYHVGASTLLTHFHFCHNSSYPFSAAGEKADVLIAAGLSDSQKRFIQNTRKFVTDNVHRFKGDDACEDDCYYISQLYERDWKPRAWI